MISSVWCRFSGVFWCLTLVFNLVFSIKIENQLKVITNDCYERLAIGHRLSSKDVYKTVKANTVPKCQKECTAEGDYCKAFSFGIGEKGNSTCELGKNFIKETANLQPIGTIQNVDFDLYIKKLGCKLVIDPQASKPKPHFNDVPQSQSSTTQEQYGTQNGPKPTYLPEKPTNTKPPQPDGYPNEALNKPSEIPQKPLVTYGASIPNVELVKPGAYENTKPKPEEYNVQHSPNTHLIQGSLVSVSPGIQSYLHPVHDILIGENPYSYGRPKPGRPLGYLPETSNGVTNGNNNYHYGKPYGGYQDDKYTTNVYKRPYDYDRYKPGYSQRPWGSGYTDNPKFLSPFDPYYDERPIQRPHQKPYEDNVPHKPHYPYDQESPYKPPSSGSSYYEKPSSLSDNYRPPPNSLNGYEDERPSYSINKPQRPNSYDFQVFTENSKPYKPVHEKPEESPPRPYEGHLPPFRPPNLNNPYNDERPIFSSRPRPTGYETRPSILDDRIDISHHTRPYLKPEHPDYGVGYKPPKFEYDEIPRPIGSLVDRRPQQHSDKYPLRPQSDGNYNRIPEGSYYGPQGYDYRRPLRPDEDYRRPNYELRRHEDDLRRPIRPEDDLRRPLRPEDDFRMPEGSFRKPWRPEEDFRRPPRPERDHGNPPNNDRYPNGPENDRRKPALYDDERLHYKPIDLDDKGYPRPDFHDRRPYDQRKPENENFEHRIPDYLFSANDRNDVISNSTQFLNSSITYLDENDTKGGNNTVSDKGVHSGEILKNGSLSNSIITESNGMGGEKITSIITPIKDDLNVTNSATMKSGMQNSRTIAHQVRYLISAPTFSGRIVNLK